MNRRKLERRTRLAAKIAAKWASIHYFEAYNNRLLEKLFVQWDNDREIERRFGNMRLYARMVWPGGVRLNNHLIETACV